MPFSPSDLSNLKVWYKADSLALGNGAGVASWPDSSGNGFDLYDQNTSAKQPTFLTNQLNSLPAVSFDGSSDELRTGSSGGGGTSVTWGSDLATIFCVIQDNSPNPTAGVAVTWLHADDGSGSPMWLLSRYNNTTTARFRGFNNTPTSFDVTATVSNGTTSGDWHYLSAIRRSGDVQLYVDGNGVTLVSTSGTNQNKSTPLWIGGIFGGGFTMMKLAEAIVYTAAINDTDRQSVESYLNNKWFVAPSTETYPAGHHGQLMNSLLRM